MLKKVISMRLRSLVSAALALITVLTLSLAVFAEETSDEEKSAIAKWWEAYNQYIGYGVAAVLAVVIIVVIYWWIPKNPKKKDGQKKKELPKKN